MLLDLVVRVTKTCGRTEGLTLTVPVTTLKKNIMSKNSGQYEIGNTLKLRFNGLSLCVWSQMNGRSRIYFVARLWTRSSFRIRSIDRGVQTCVAQPKWDLTRVRYAEHLTVMHLSSLLFLGTYPRSLHPLTHCSLTCFFHVWLSVM